MSNLFAIDLVEIARCGAEPIHSPGIVQSHGALIGVDRKSLQIMYASENAGEFLQKDRNEILCGTLDDLFDNDARHTLVNGIMHGTHNQRTKVLGQIKVGHTALLATSSPSPNCTIFEFEKVISSKALRVNNLQDLDFLLAQVRIAQSEAELFKTSTGLLQMLTGYDRVMVYEFDAEGHGAIHAEAVVGGLEPFLEMHFPSWNIPAQARQIMARTPLHYVADINAPASALFAASADLPPLDMTTAHLRGLSPEHLQNLQDVGSLATFTLNIIMNGRPWGMISFHHGEPRVPNHDMRQICQSFASIFSLVLECLRNASSNNNCAKADE